MKCKEFESSLNELLDLRRDPESDSTLLAHAQECPECEQTLEYYSAFAQLGQSVTLDPTPAQQQRPYAYFAIGTAAAILLFLLSPLANIGNQNNGNAMNIAKAAPGEHVLDANRTAKNTRLAKIDSEFWQRRSLANIRLMEGFAFRVPEAPNLQQVGQSINSMWKSIQEDDFLLPIIQQSALLWMQ